MSNLTYVLVAVFTTFLSYDGHFDVRETNFHPVHVSFTNVEYIKENKQFPYKLFNRK